MSKPLELTRGSVRAHITACKACELGRRPDMTPVSFRGPTPAKVVICGEAPGSQETVSGKPFVGPAGQWLSGCLRQAGWEEADLLLMNAGCMCDPWGAPPAFAVHACTPNISMLLKLANPSYIITLGRFALCRFYPHEKSVMRVRGQIRDWKSRKIFITVHPSWVMRDKKGRTGPFINDLEMFRKEIEKLEAQASVAARS